MSQSKRKTESAATPGWESFEVGHLARLWVEQGQRALDEVEKAGQQVLAQSERMRAETEKLWRAQLETTARLFDASLEAARRIGSAALG